MERISGIGLRSAALLLVPAASGAAQDTRIQRVFDGTIHVSHTSNSGTEVFAAENQYVRMFEHFSRCLLEGSAPRYGPDDAIRQMKVVDAVRRSILSGRAESV